MGTGSSNMCLAIIKDDRLTVSLLHHQTSKLQTDCETLTTTFCNVIVNVDGALHA